MILAEKKVVAFLKNSTQTRLVLWSITDWQCAKVNN